MSTVDTTSIKHRQTTVKRPFDVAFLMLPDDKLTKKIYQHRQPTKTNVSDEDDDDDDDDDEDDDEEIEILDVKIDESAQTQKQQIFGETTMTSTITAQIPQRNSAFTKVTTNCHTLPMLPPPPTLAQFVPPPESYFTANTTTTPPPAYYTPNVAAAALLTTLLPPSLAALSLPTQNVCAKCNISFRMTSDLVYHMRSHHKNDSLGEAQLRRRREEKLKCPVCAESFRERHHLTRHMTAHQDKAADCEEFDAKRKIC